MNPARKEAITLFLGCCDNEVPIREPTQDFAQMANINPRLRLRWINDSILARPAKLVPNFFSIFKRMAPFVEADVERLVRRVNSQTETNDQEWCTSEGSPVRAGSKTNSRDALITGSPARFDPPCESVLARTSAARQSRRLSCGRRLCCYLIDQGSGKQRAGISRGVRLLRSVCRLDLRSMKPFTQRLVIISGRQF
jgi:hypothetical protein